MTTTNLGIELDRIRVEGFYTAESSLERIPIKYPIWKALFDYLVALIGLILALPLMIFIALLIKLEDGGPVFFYHDRVGARGRRFKLIKFRTMHVDAEERLKELLESDPKLREEWEANYKLKDDPRVTRIGKFLRKTSLDELPQLINVLKGEMSLIGPRPVTEEEFRKFYAHVSHLYASVKPGLTGFWQVEARNDCESYEKRVEMDVYYIENMSFFFFFKILLETFWIVITTRGAY